jgi:hypothetical protein
MLELAMLVYEENLITSIVKMFRTSYVFHSTIYYSVV